MSACDHCNYWYSYDCDDGYNKHKNRESFELDFSTLTNKHKKTIQKFLI